MFISRMPPFLFRKVRALYIKRNTMTYNRRKISLSVLCVGAAMFFCIRVDFRLLNYHKWYGDGLVTIYNSTTMINYSSIRCKAKHLGCFVPFNELRAEYRKLRLLNITRSEMKRVCLGWCFSSYGLYVGLAMDSLTCLCSSKVEGFISDKQSKRWAESRWNLAKSCATSTSIDVYMKNGKCGKNVTGDITYELMGWTTLPKGEKMNGMFRLPSPTVNTNQCVFSCGSKGFIIAMPYLKGNICYCCGYSSLFTNAEAMTGLASQHDANTNSIPVYRTYAEDSACMVRFGNLPTSIVPIALTSFPGSGNTWIRHLLEISTGVYTGSVYGDMDLYEAGMLGEPPAEKLVKQIVVKDHIFHRPKVRPQYKSAILLIRNPYHAVIAEWSRRRTKNHVGHPPPKVFNTVEFQKFAYACANDWLAHCEFTLKRKWKVLVIYYENLRENPVKEMRRVADFLQLSSTDHRKNFERRLMCMQSDLAGKFKRPRRNFGFDPFAEPSLWRRFEDAIKKANNSLIEYQFPPLPNSYL